MPEKLSGVVFASHGELWCGEALLSTSVCSRPAYRARYLVAAAVRQTGL